jgi:hypothetical protein
MMRSEEQSHVEEAKVVIKVDASGARKCGAYA